jgi:hypothetical protein
MLGIEQIYSDDVAELDGKRIGKNARLRVVLVRAVA